MFEQTQFDLLRAWIIAATELDEVILAHPSAPRPQTNYAVLNLTRSDRIGRPVQQQLEANPLSVGTPPTIAPFFEFVAQEYEFTWSLHIYSTEPITVANRLVPWFHSNTGREYLGELNAHKLGSVQKMPELVNNNWQDRSIMEMHVRSYVCTSTVDYDTQTILLGQVPVDCADIVDTIHNLGALDRTETTTKP